MSLATAIRVEVPRTLDRAAAAPDLETLADLFGCALEMLAERGIEGVSLRAIVVTRSSRTRPGPT